MGGMAAGNPLRCENEFANGELTSSRKIQLPAAAPHALEGNVLSWFDGIRKGTPVYPSLEDGIAAVATVFAAEESVKTGKVVKVK